MCDEYPWWLLIVVAWLGTMAGVAIMSLLAMARDDDDVDPWGQPRAGR